MCPTYLKALIFFPYSINLYIFHNRHFIQRARVFFPRPQRPWEEEHVRCRRCPRAPTMARHEAPVWQGCLSVSFFYYWFNNAILISDGRTVEVRKKQIWFPMYLYFFPVVLPPVVCPLYWLLFFLILWDLKCHLGAFFIKKLPLYSHGMFSLSH